MGPDIADAVQFLILELMPCFENTHGESRTHNPPIRSRMPCPLGHAGAIKTWLTNYNLSSCIFNGFPYVPFVAAIHAKGGMAVRLDSVNGHCRRVFEAGKAIAQCPETSFKIKCRPGRLPHQHDEHPTL
jgi:hypothetical protein